MSEYVYKEMLDVVMKDVVNHNNESLTFYAEDGREFVFYHEQDCCECVEIESIVGDLKDLIGAPIVEATESSSETDNDYGTETWTFYRFSAAGKGTVVVRWLGSSNGYYSESVNFKIDEPDSDEV